MHLKNKKTGEIGWLETYYGDTDEKMIAVLDKKSEYHPYNSLTELNEDWEDYEEPKEFWYIDYNGTVKCFQYYDYVWQKEMQSLGNYFETEKEAEKAVEKLKAWKRLKDKGFRFYDWYWKTQNISYLLDYTAISEESVEEAEEDLDLLFGGEE